MYEKPVDAATSNEPGAFSFSGRARRSTYWKMVIISSVLVGVLCGTASGVSGNAFEYGMGEGFEALGGVAVFLILLALPLLIWAWAVQVRRCHDLGWSGWRLFICWLVGLIPFVGWIAPSILGIFLGFVDGQPFTNQYGPDPKGRNVNAASPQQATPVPSITAAKNLPDQLRELKQLLDDGILTQEEFDAKKADLLRKDS